MNRDLKVKYLLYCRGEITSCFRKEGEKGMEIRWHLGNWSLSCLWEMADAGVFPELWEAYWRGPLWWTRGHRLPSQGSRLVTHEPSSSDREHPVDKRCLILKLSWECRKPFVKSGWGEGKRKEKGGRKCLHLHWLLDVGNRIDYSNHRAVAATRHWLNGYISSTSSQISPDGWLWEFSMSYNCSGPGNQIVALFSMRAIVPGMLEDSWCPHYG